MDAYSEVGLIISDICRVPAPCLHMGLTAMRTERGQGRAILSDLCLWGGRKVALSTFIVGSSKVCQVIGLPGLRSLASTSSFRLFAKYGIDVAYATTLRESHQVLGNSIHQARKQPSTGCASRCRQIETIYVTHFSTVPQYWS